ncbi:protein of unknown function [Acetoanaerobium sticklandii]|uniref:Uncharacterized protein n=1 Tax=Acetoanaerobium sticklandii (strain ATCC 12662 / DSM 519 / JCM 1433 / CCUG 9281 / NCIMB 10654 / HF) TaxID=499177 RepID=E3PTF8_ACESD|nr:hypothetical protein [Acetoanaerobium sticklandii]CBH22162.1 protein of unknown function [Acetoanaerobium sticklandii]
MIVSNTYVSNPSTLNPPKSTNKPVSEYSNSKEEIEGYLSGKNNLSESLIGKIDLRNATYEEVSALKRELCLSDKITVADRTVISMLSVDFRKVFGVNNFKTVEDSEGRRDWITEFKLRVEANIALGMSPTDVAERKGAISKLISYSKSGSSDSEIKYENVRQSSTNSTTNIDIRNSMINYSKIHFASSSKNELDEKNDPFKILDQHSKDNYNKYTDPDEINRRSYLLSFLKK